ncbi:MAG: type-F conjugative transfer system secretin TraK [Candidatus Binatia bacterium]
MRRLIGLVAILLLPSILQAKVVRWEGKPLGVSISTERLTRIEFPEPMRSVFLSRADIAVEKEDKSLYLRALVPDVQDTLFVVGESGTAYEINLFVSEKPDETVLISHTPRFLEVQAERARKVPGLDLMRSMMKGLPVDGYEVIKADYKEVYRDAFFSMKLVKVYRSPVLHGYVIEVENLAEFPVLLRVQDVDFSGMIAISADGEYLRPRPKKASEAVQEKFRTYLYIVALLVTGRY